MAGGRMIPFLAMLRSLMMVSRCMFVMLRGGLMVFDATGIGRSGYRGFNRKLRRARRIGIFLRSIAVMPGIVFPRLFAMKDSLHGVTMRHQSLMRRMRIVFADPIVRQRLSMEIGSLRMMMCRGCVVRHRAL